MVAYSLEQSAEVEVVPAQTEADAIGKSWQRAVADFYAVARVEFSVAVGVPIEEVAEFGPLVGGEVIRIPVDQRLNIIQVRLVAHDSVDRYHIQLIDRLPFLSLIDSVYRRDIALEFRDFVVHKAHVQPDIV